MEKKNKWKSTIKYLQLLGLGLLAFFFVGLMHKVGNFIVYKLNLAPMTTFWIGLSIPVIISTAFGILIMVLYGHEFWLDDKDETKKK